MLLAPVWPLASFARRVRNLAVRRSLIPGARVSVALLLGSVQCEGRGSLDKNTSARLVAVVIELADRVSKWHLFGTRFDVPLKVRRCTCAVAHNRFGLLDHLTDVAVLLADPAMVQRLTAEETSLIPALAR
jgi:hypothetical protein